MRRGHVTGRKKEREGAGDWYEAIEAETLAKLDAENAKPSRPMPIHYDILPTLARGLNYAAHIVVGGRHVILGHYLTDNFEDIAALKATAQAEATAQLQSYGYSAAEIAGARACDCPLFAQ